MAYFYVKNSLGTRTTGGGLTKQTGTFTALGASNVYATIGAAITDGAGAGDYICISTAHSESQASDHFIAGPTSGDCLYFISVDDSNCDAFQKASSAQLTTTGSGNDFIFANTGSSRTFWQGVYFDTEGTLVKNQSTDPNVLVIMDQCTLDCNISGSYIFDTYADGFHWYLSNSTIAGNTGTLSSARYDCVIVWRNVTVTGVINLWTALGASAGGCSIDAIGCDLSSITAHLFSDGGATIANDDAIRVRYIGCKTNASLTAFWDPGQHPQNYHQNMLVQATSSSSSTAEYQYYWRMFGGVIEQDTSFYRDGSDAYPDSSQKISLKCVTDSDASVGMPFYFDIPSRYADLSSTSEDVIKIHLLTSATLDDAEVWAEATYPDGTNKNEYNFLSTRHTDIMDASGTTLTTNTETWTGRTTENRYEISIDTSSDAGIACIPIIRVYVAVASTTIYFCPCLEVS